MTTLILLPLFLLVVLLYAVIEAYMDHRAILEGFPIVHQMEFLQRMILIGLLTWVITLLTSLGYWPLLLAGGSLFSVAFRITLNSLRKLGWSYLGPSDRSLPGVSSYDTLWWALALRLRPHLLDQEAYPTLPGRLATAGELLALSVGLLLA